MVTRLVAGQHQQLLDVAPRGAVDQPLDLVGLVQVRLVRRERAVLAVRDAGPRQGERDVARERDPAAHPRRSLRRRARRAARSRHEAPARPRGSGPGGGGAALLRRRGRAGARRSPGRAKTSRGCASTLEISSAARNTSASRAIAAIMRRAQRAHPVGRRLRRAALAVGRHLREPRAVGRDRRAVPGLQLARRRLAPGLGERVGIAEVRAHRVAQQRDVAEPERDAAAGRRVRARPRVADGGDARDRGRRPRGGGRARRPSASTPEIGSPSSQCAWSGQARTSAVQAASWRSRLSGRSPEAT